MTDERMTQNVRSLVLLSGGLDSTAALIWALREGREPETVFIYYGQPAAGAEAPRAIAATRELLGVDKFHRLDMATAYYGGHARGLFTPQPSGVNRGVDTAFVPVRNALLLTASAARAQMLWPDQPVELIVGFNANDAAGFPDCRMEFLAAFERAMDLALGESGAVRISAPWLQMEKRAIVDYVRRAAPEHLGLLEASWSCYREHGPCGECTACLVRDAAMRRSP